MDYDCMKEKEQLTGRGGRCPARSTIRA